MLLDQAGDLLQSGRAGQAATLLTPVVGEEPDNAGAWRLLARARLDLGEPGAALAAARAALRLEPGGVESLYLVSAAYSATGRHELAISAARAACAEDPGNPLLAERLGRARLAAGLVAEAETGLRVAAEFAYYDADLHVAHGVALFAAARPLSAREAYGRALRIDPEHPRAGVELRRLAAAEREIVDAESLVGAADRYAESLRVPAGGHPEPAAGTAAAAHTGCVTLTVCLAAVLILAVLDLVVRADVPPSLIVALAAVAASAAGVRALARRHRAGLRP